MAKVSPESGEVFVSALIWDTAQATMRYFPPPPEGPAAQELVWFPTELLPEHINSQLWRPYGAFTQFAALENAGGRVVGFLFR